MDIKIKTTNTTAPLLRLSPDAIKEFQQIYFKEYKIHLSAEDADRKARKLLELFAVIYKPIKKYEYANK